MKKVTGSLTPRDHARVTLISIGGALIATSCASDWTSCWKYALAGYFVAMIGGMALIWYERATAA